MWNPQKAWHPKVALQEMQRQVQVQHDPCVGHEWISRDVHLQWPFSLKKICKKTDLWDLDQPCEIRGFDTGGMGGQGTSYGAPAAACFQVASSSWSTLRCQVPRRCRMHLDAKRCHEP